MKEQDVSDIKSTKWILDLAFMVDTTKHLNELNLNLQGKNKLVISIYNNIKAFKTKLQLKNGNLVLKTCESTFVQNELQLSINDYSEKI
jgi:hypothetical protein